MSLRFDHHYFCLGIVPKSPKPYHANPKLELNLRVGGSRRDLRCEAASISSDFPDEVLGGEKKKKKKRSISGIEQDELLDPTDLADPDSCFLPFNGIELHYKMCHPTATCSNTNTSIILLHGFGASVFSWDRVMKPLSNLITSKVLAFDRPAFGLTSRSPTPTTPPTLNPYSIHFSVLATLFFIHFLAAHKTILIGHSAGSLVAVDTYFEAPERVAAMILVAPAILAPLTSSKAVKSNRVEKGYMDEEESSSSNVQVKPLTIIGNLFSKFASYISHSVVGMLKGMVNMVGSLYRRALAAILRSTFAVMIVRMVIDKFGIAAIKNAWYDASQITDDVLHGYTKPLRAKGWDRALVEYTIAMLTDSPSESKLPLSKRLNEISCPVLIITGDSDRLVPSWNAERLSRAIPGSCLEIIKNCGHLPQEEKVEEFVSVVQKFLQGVPKQQHLQAAT